jgi:hypothetical protein
MKCLCEQGTVDINSMSWDAYRSQAVCPVCRRPLVAYQDLRPLNEIRCTKKWGLLKPPFKSVKL